MGIGQNAVVQDLQKHVEHVGVRFLDFIEQNDGIGFSSYLFGKLTALVKPDIAGRRTHKTGNGVFLHVFGHIEPDHRVFVAEHGGRKRFAKLGFADAGGA